MILGAVLALEAMVERRHHRLLRLKPALVTFTFTVNFEAYREGIEALVRAFGQMGITMEQLARSMVALAEGFMVGEPEIPLDHSKCWRCQSVAVSGEDDLGLCTTCVDYLQTL